MDENYDKISSALDRFQEAHFWIHMMEQFYHSADPFRWHLNVFIKAIKEVSQIIQMELQNEKGFAKWYKNERTNLNNDPLMSALSKRRDIIVHKGMLVPNSKAMLGITEGRGIKLGLTFPVHPLEDSDNAMDRYLHQVSKHEDFLGVLIMDEDSLPCVQREWRLEGFEEEIIDLCAKAWFRLGETIKNVLLWLGEKEVPNLSLDCRHSSQHVQFQLFDREVLIKRLNEINESTKA